MPKAPPTNWSFQVLVCAGEVEQVAVGGIEPGDEVDHSASVTSPTCHEDSQSAGT